ncbi:peptide deformylase [Cyanobacterium stanieri LEGE 03274]|uniref:Peptide deformylase n=1 Tax=Cyanobacterium stanieri LEGE 03274 TaxID=1828756 RepID=A0ABR9V0H6_9CHRO|nr:peptide deformylase [Cyanobacterium stanieri]MBE9221384.1 peptide deformylase [Cyanobacterium stanieri LEGE 03274]
MVEILQIGNPILRKVAPRVENIHASDIQELIDMMLKMVFERHGVGLAAPQIGYSTRVVVVASHPNARYPHAPFMAPMEMINPEIISFSDDFLMEEEGCLSVKGTRADVLRYGAIALTYYNRKGEKQEREFHGFIARIIQHEIDHLNGILFVDHLKKTQNPAIA